MASGSAVQSAAVVTASETEAAVALAATPWQTTGAVDQDGAPVALDDPRAMNFVGNAYFKADGTFTMFNLDDSPKMQGAWEMREVDGALVRWIAAKDPAGAVLFERTVPIVALDSAEFTYRVVSAEDPASWVDIVHTPTDHAEPGRVEDADSGGGTSDGGSADGGGSTDSGGSASGNGSESLGSTGEAGRNGVSEPAEDTVGTEPRQLAETGGTGPSTGIMVALAAFVSGAVLLVRRGLRHVGN